MASLWHFNKIPSQGVWGGILCETVNKLVTGQFHDTLLYRYEENIPTLKKKKENSVALVR
jgi:hypothetical protein